MSSIDTSNRFATATTCSLNIRQRNAGSGPSIRITSPPGVDALHNPTVGHTIERVIPSLSRTCGRTVAKSVNSSGSISASGWAFHASIR